jgi:hypothetical protein
MKKDFDNWNKRKKEINEEEPHFYREREIRWCSLGITTRLQERLAVLDEDRFGEIKKAIRNLIL